MTSCRGVKLITWPCVRRPTYVRINISCTIVFLGRHFLFTSSDTFAEGYIVQPQHTAKTEPRSEISASGIDMDKRGHVTIVWLRLFQTRHFLRFGCADIPHVLRSTIGLLSDSYTLLWCRSKTGKRQWGL